MQRTLHHLNRAQFGNYRSAGLGPVRAGFTLIELVFAMVITSILMVAMGSAMVIATKAMPNSSSPGVADLEGGRVIDQIAQEVSTALSFSVRSANAVVFKVADRDNDANSEMISYAWLGTAGDPLTRQYNGGTPVNVAEDVYEFELSYDTKIITEQIPTTIQSSETQFVGYTSPISGIDLNISANQWLSQHFQPSLPPDTLRWRITRVMLMARQQGLPDGTTLVQLRPADPNNLPTSTVLEQRVMNESDLTSSYVWQQFNFNVSDQFPGDSLCLVLEWVQGDDSATFQCDSGGGSGHVLTTDQGSNWSHGSGDSMLYSVYGTYTTPGTAVIVPHSYLKRVRVGLRIGSASSARVDTAIPIVNVPEVNP